MVEPGGPFYGPMNVNWSPAAALLAALVVAGCGGGSGPTSAQLVRTHGVLVRVGGLAPGEPVAMPGVRLHFQGSAGSTDVRTDGKGRFSFAVAAGRYLVSVRTGGLPPLPLPHAIVVPHAGRIRLVVSVK
jgi:hypothetical protein